LFELISLTLVVECLVDECRGRTIALQTFERRSVADLNAAPLQTFERNRVTDIFPLFGGTGPAPHAAIPPHVKNAPKRSEAA
jgi:hypothetical protein